MFGDLTPLSLKYNKIIIKFTISIAEL